MRGVCLVEIHPGVCCCHCPGPLGTPGRRARARDTPRRDDTSLRTRRTPPRSPPPPPRSSRCTPGGTAPSQSPTPSPRVPRPARGFEPTQAQSRRAHHRAVEFRDGRLGAAPLSNCTKPHPFPGGIFTYTRAPADSKRSRRFVSFTEASRPPTNTVAHSAGSTGSSSIPGERACGVSPARCASHETRTSRRSSPSAPYRAHPPARNGQIRNPCFDRWTDR